MQYMRVDNFPGVMRILVAAEILVHSPSVVCGGDADARHHFANEFYAFAVIGPAVIGSDSFVKNLACTFADPAIELCGFWVAIEPPTCRIRCVFADVGSLVPERVNVSSVSAAM